eukprot:751518-Hanusia_phi.AAC.2
MSVHDCAYSAYADAEEARRYRQGHSYYLARLCSSDEVCGFFSIGSSFPRRSAHVCNLEIFTVRSHRRKGIGSIMCMHAQHIAREQGFLSCSLLFAPLLDRRVAGYEMIWAPLVFVSNVEACEMMRKMGFRLLAVLPRAGRLEDGRSRTDAMQFFLPLQERRGKPRPCAVEKDSCVDEEDQEWMKYAMRLAVRAGEEGEIPVGAVVVMNKTIVGEGRNAIRERNDPSGHAEMIAIRQAALRLGNYR